MESSSSYAVPAHPKPITRSKTSLKLKDEIAATLLRTSATRGMVSLIAADPGAGKSRFTRRAIAQQISSGEYTRVVYFAPDTLEEAALGVEALKHFTKLGVNASIVYGRKEAKERGIDYRTQFEWRDRSVLILPHAYLGLLDIKIIADLVESADLAVCDEDASGALLKPHEFDVGLAPTHPLMQIFGHWQPNANNQPGDRSWVSLNYSGEIAKIIVPDGEIAKLLKTAKMTVAELADFAEARAPTGRGHHSEIAKALVENALVAGKHNVQLRYEQPVKGQAGKLSISVAIKTQLPSFMPPLVILDAFGTPEKYEAVLGCHVEFNNFRSGRLPKIKTIIMDGGSFNKVALDVILKRRRNGHPNEGQAILGFTALTIVRQMNPSRPLTLIGFKDHLEPLIAEIKRIYKLYHGTEPDIKPFHFYAGRGVNSHEGRDIIMLMAPNSNIEQGLLIAGAVYPEVDQTAQRHQFHSSLVEGELHQALHRARPLQRADVTLTVINPSSFADNDELGEFQPPHWQHNLREHSHDHIRDEFVLLLFRGLRELIVALGTASPLAAGIPMAALAAAELTDDLQSHGEKYRELLKVALDQHGDPALRQHWAARWLIDGVYPEKVLPREMLKPWRTMQAKTLQPLSQWLSSQLGMRSAADGNILLMPGITPARGQSLLNEMKPLGAARGGRRV